MEIVQAIQHQFITLATRTDFWYYHGLGLTLVWLVFSFFGILIKKILKGGFGLFLHAIIFLVTDLTTLVLAGAAFYRVYPHISKFPEWSLLKQGHIGGGIIFVVFMIFQHIGGVASAFGADGSAHKRFGYVVSTGLKLVAIGGWLLAKNEQFALYCGIITVIQFLVLVSIKKSKSKSDVKQEKSGNVSGQKNKRKLSPKKD